MRSESRSRSKSNTSQKYKPDTNSVAPSKSVYVTFLPEGVKYFLNQIT